MIGFVERGPWLGRQMARPMWDLMQGALGNACHAAVILTDGALGRFEFSGTTSTPGPLASPFTHFDGASLTKLATATAVLRLVALGLVGLDDPLNVHVPEFAGGGREYVTIRHLLSHSSGLPRNVELASIPAGCRPAVVARERWWDMWQRLYHTPLDERPGVRVQYSDPGYMLLSLLIERTMRAPLDVAVQDLVLRPLGMSGTQYGFDATAPATIRNHPERGLVQGTVMDYKTFVSGLTGSAATGCAGLFAPARDWKTLAEQYLYPGGRFLPLPLVKEAITEQGRRDYPLGVMRYGLCWELRSTFAGAPEEPLSPDAFGATGFTGTSVWVDPRDKQIYVVLTNSVVLSQERFPSRRNALNEFVRRFHALVLGSVEGRML